MDDQVPTWNYVSVHLRGQLGLLPPEDLRGQLDRLAASFEERIAGKTPWVADKMNPEALERLMRMIVPVRLAIASVDGTWKLGQNKPEPARKGAAAGMEAAGIGAEIAGLAALMRAVQA
jgi:transcriptional regulator